MPAVEVSHIAKSFGPVQAVDDVSFVVEGGEIFALLGPNGAGKTTTIRILLDIFKPDRGQVSVFSGPVTPKTLERIGYMPEERGLYQDVPLEACLVYLAQLKGLGTADAKRRISALLERFELAKQRKNKVKELSKGMQQKAQIISTIVHDPALLIIDEPFAALDPVNTQLAKDVLLELRGKGCAIIISTHQMHHAEELCDRLVLIDHGRIVLEGDLDAIRHRFAGNAVWVRGQDELPSLPGVESVTRHNGTQRWALAADTTPQDVLRALVAQGVAIERFELALPTLEEIFVRTVQGGGV
jgi:ABC-2 type transport system ATP-binding protein